MSITLSYVVPVHNESPIIQITLEQFTRDFTCLRNIVSDYEILVVDDGSTDDTPTIVEEFARQNTKVRLLRHEKNQGAGKAILTGLEKARMEWLSANFADQPFHVEDIRNLAPLFEGSDMIVVCRTDRKANSWYRKLTSFGNYALIRLLFWSGIHDFQFVQFYRRTILERMPIISRGALVPPEMILRSVRQGARMSEIFRVFHERNGGSSKYGNPKYILETLIDMTRLRINFWKEDWKRSIVAHKTERGS